MSYDLFETFKTIEKIKINCFLELTLSPPRAIILMLCKMNQDEHKHPVRPSQISERLEVKPAAITPILNKLETEGFIKREVSPQDRREVLVTLTQAGTDECINIENHMKAYFDRLVKSVGQDTIDEFKLLCKKFDEFNEAELHRRLKHESI